THTLRTLSGRRGLFCARTWLLLRLWPRRCSDFAAIQKSVAHYGPSTCLVNNVLFHRHRISALDRVQPSLPPLNDAIPSRLVLPVQWKWLRWGCAGGEVLDELAQGLFR